MKFSFPFAVRFSLILLASSVDFVLAQTNSANVTASPGDAAASGQILPVKIDRPWMQAVPSVASDTAIFMKVENLGQVPLKLVGASCPIAAHVEPMITTRQVEAGHQTIGMESVPALDIPAGGTLELRPGGNHLMVMGLKSHPKEGDHVKVVLIFAPNAQQVEVEPIVLKHQPE